MSEETTRDRTEVAGKADKWLLLYLRFIGGFTLLAFAAAMMPEKWMVEIAQVLTIDPFPSHPLTFYLARNLSLIYGFVGVGVLVITSDLTRYRPMVRMLAIGTMVFGILQIVCDSMSVIPWWWTWGEGLSTFFGGALMFWLDANCRHQINETLTHEGSRTTEFDR